MANVNIPSTSTILPSIANLMQYRMPASIPSTSSGIFNPFDNTMATSDPASALTPNLSSMIQSDATYIEANSFNDLSAQHETNGSYGSQLGSGVINEGSNHQEFLGYISTFEA
ncbi:hypothetical protein F5146DRAFT_1007013 [Armillaria mellea]|nr:hypothetical protein F5146DRAFT_1007013 [Armillaria mellea]